MREKLWRMDLTRPECYWKRIPFWNCDQERVDSDGYCSF